MLVAFFRAKLVFIYHQIVQCTVKVLCDIVVLCTCTCWQLFSHVSFHSIYTYGTLMVKILYFEKTHEFVAFQVVSNL